MSQFSHLFLMKKCLTQTYELIQEMSMDLFPWRFSTAIVLSNMRWEWLHNSYDIAHIARSTLAVAVVRADALMKFETK